MLALLTVLATLGAPVAIRIEDYGDVPLADATDIADQLGRAIERAGGEAPQVDDPTWTSCATLPVCLAEVRARTGARDVILLKIFGGVTRVRVEARRFGAGESPTAGAEADLERDRTTWPTSIGVIARALSIEAAPRRAEAETTSEGPPPAHASAVPWILVGAGAVCLAVAIGFGASSASARDAVESEPHAPAEVEALTSRLKAHGLAANLLFGAGAISTAVGGVLLLVF